MNGSVKLLEAKVSEISASHSKAFSEILSVIRDYQNRGKLPGEFVDEVIVTMKRNLRRE